MKGEGRTNKLLNHCREGKMDGKHQRDSQIKQMPAAAAATAAAKGWIGG